jgi:hypothetical protein
MQRGREKWSVSQDDAASPHRNRRIKTVKHECLTALNNSSMALLYAWQVPTRYLVPQGETRWKASMPCRSDMLGMFGSMWSAYSLTAFCVTTYV